MSLANLVEVVPMIDVRMKIMKCQLFPVLAYGRSFVFERSLVQTSVNITYRKGICHGLGTTLLWKESQDLLRHLLRKCYRLNFSNGLHNQKLSNFTCDKTSIANS